MTFTYVPAVPPTDFTRSYTEPDYSSPDVCSDTADPAQPSATNPTFSVTLHSGRVVDVVRSTTYEPEGPLTTFFRSGSSSRTLDVWSVRVASFRTADIVSIRQREGSETRHPSAQNLDAPVLSLVAG